MHEGILDRVILLGHLYPCIANASSALREHLFVVGVAKLFRFSVLRLLRCPLVIRILSNEIVVGVFLDSKSLLLQRPRALRAGHEKNGKESINTGKFHGIRLVPLLFATCEAATSRAVEHASAMLREEQRPSRAGKRKVALPRGGLKADQKSVLNQIIVAPHLILHERVLYHLLRSTSGEKWGSLTREASPCANVGGFPPSPPPRTQPKSKREVIVKLGQYLLHHLIRPKGAPPSKIIYFLANRIPAFTEGRAIWKYIFQIFVSK